MAARRSRLENLEDERIRLGLDRMHHYRSDPNLTVPNEYNLSDVDRLALYQRRVDHLQSLMNTTQRLNDDNREFRYEFRRDYYLARDNYYFYGARLGLDQSGINASLVPTSRPPPLPEFQNTNNNDSNLYLISRAHLNALINIGNRLKLLNECLEVETRELKDALKEEQNALDYERFIEDSPNNDIP